MQEHVAYHVYDALRRDRDKWRRNAKVQQSEVARLTLEVTRLNRALVDQQRNIARNEERSKVFG